MRTNGMKNGHFQYRYPDIICFLSCRFDSRRTRLLFKFLMTCLPLIFVTTIIPLIAWELDDCIYVKEEYQFFSYNFTKLNFIVCAGMLGALVFCPCAGAGGGGNCNCVC